MLPALRSVVVSVVATLVPGLDTLDRISPEIEAFAASYVIAQIDRMPAHLRTAMLGLEAVFEAGAIVRYGKPFTHLSTEQRRAYLGAWTLSKIATQRDYVRFHRSLTIFALYSKLMRAA